MDSTQSSVGRGKHFTERSISDRWGSAKCINSTSRHSDSGLSKRERVARRNRPQTCNRGQVPTPARAGSASTPAPAPVALTAPAPVPTHSATPEPSGMADTDGCSSYPLPLMPAQDKRTSASIVVRWHLSDASPVPQPEEEEHGQRRPQPSGSDHSGQETDAIVPHDDGIGLRVQEFVYHAARGRQQLLEKQRP